MDPLTNWPKATAVFKREIQEQTSAIANRHVAPSAEAIIRYEVSLCNTDLGLPPDIGIYEQFHIRSPDWAGILVNLHWRLFRQATMWTLFCHLHEKGLVTLDCLTLPIDFLELSHESFTVLNLLFCFPALRSLCNFRFIDVIPLQSSQWYCDLEWLATVITRNGADVAALVTEIEASRIAGRIDDEFYKCFKEKYPSPEIPHRERDSEKHLTGNVRFDNFMFGLWLPHGLSQEREERCRQLKAHLQRARDILHAYNTMVGESKGSTIGLFENLSESESDIASASDDMPLLPLFKTTRPECEGLDEDHSDEASDFFIPAYFWEESSA